MNPQFSQINQSIQLAGGRRLGFAEYGVKNGSPVLFFHGAPGSSYLHADVAEIAAQNNVRLIAVDRPGYGLSDPQAGRTFLSFAEDIKFLTDSLGVNKFAIIGFSGGSPYPLACAFRFPDRVKKIALVGALVAGMTEGMPPMVCELYNLAQTNPAELRKIFATVAPSASALLSIMSSTASDWDKKLFNERATEFEQDYARTLLGGIEGMASDYILISGNLGFSLEAIGTEVHLYSGSVDQNIPPAMTQYLSTQLPNNHVHLFQNEGHFALYQHWDEILNSVK
jgi:pimeloyl-ACP methyl ester carboxylesterase